MFDPTFFYHKACMVRKYEMQKAAAEERAKIDLIKKAIREIEAERGKN